MVTQASTHVSWRCRLIVMFQRQPLLKLLSEEQVRWRLTNRHAFLRARAPSSGRAWWLWGKTEWENRVSSEHLSASSNYHLTTSACLLVSTDDDVTSHFRSSKSDKNTSDAIELSTTCSFNAGDVKDENYTGAASGWKYELRTRSDDVSSREITTEATGTDLLARSNDQDTDERECL